MMQMMSDRAATDPRLKSLMDIRHCRNPPSQDPNRFQNGFKYQERNPTKQYLLHQINSDRESHISFLQKLIQAKSPNPPGDTREAAKVVSNYLNQHKVPFETLALRDDLPNIVSDFDCDFEEDEGDEEDEEDYINVEGNERRLVMSGHMDVFPVSDEDSKHWKYGPWSGHVEGDWIYGRGVVDMKAGTAAIIIAYRYLYHLHLLRTQARYTINSPLSRNPNRRRTKTKTPRRSLALTVVSDEETGSAYGARWLLGLRDDVKVPWGDRWRGTTMLNPEPSGLSSIRFGEKGTLRLTFTVTTLSAHGAYTHLTPGAIRIATSLITSLLTLETAYTSFPSSLPKSIKEHMDTDEVKKLVDSIMGKGASGVLGKVTVNVGVIRGGVKVNVIPGECVFQLDIRIPIGMSRDSILAYINDKVLPDYPEAKMEVQEAASNAPSFSPIHHPIVSIVKKNAAVIGNSKDIVENRAWSERGIKKEDRGNGELRGEEPIEIYGIGATDSKFWRYADIPAYSYGVSPKTQASRDERVEIEEFLDLIRVYVLSGWEYLGGGN